MATLAHTSSEALSQKPLLVAARGGRPARTPLWLMRQAGRYLPEYRAVREKHRTLHMFTTPSLAADITLQPLRRFDLDAAIVYADILLIPHALGLGLDFVAGEGPKFARTIRTREDVLWLRKQAADPDAVVARCDYLAETLRRVKPELGAHQTLIGFCGAPWTVASYMIEGGSAHGEFFESKMLMLKEPALFAELMDVVTDISIRYLRMQVEAGAEILQVFESWGGALTPHQYATFCAPYAARITGALRGSVPVIHFVGESAGILEPVLSVPSDVFGVDWRQDLALVRTHPALASRALQGNLDPLLLYAPFDVLEARVTSILEAGLSHPGGFIFNLGHGIRQTTPVEAVGFVVDCVHSFQPTHSTAY